MRGIGCFVLMSLSMTFIMLYCLCPGNSKMVFLEPPDVICLFFPQSSLMLFDLFFNQENVFSLSQQTALNHGACSRKLGHCLFVPFWTVTLMIALHVSIDWTFIEGREKALLKRALSPLQPLAVNKGTRAQAEQNKQWEWSRGRKKKPYLVGVTKQQSEGRK